MNINHIMIDDIGIVTVRGNMSADAIEKTRGEIESLVAKDGQKLILDMEGVAFIDSAGIGAVVYLVKKCRHSGGAVKIANVQGMVKDVFRMAGLDKALDIYPSVDLALKNFPEPKGKVLVGYDEYLRGSAVS
ncbi:MAG: STAS domain-containing protein [Syntrophus sp. (in: bacteria)]